MLQLRGRSALSEFRLNKLLASLQSRIPDISEIQTCFMHFVDVEQELNEEEIHILQQVLSYGEQEAEKQGLSIIGIFHSHPDHPNQPSEFDQEWAIPWYSYLITSVYLGQAVGSKSWRLKDDRSGFIPEELILLSEDNSQ